MTAILDGAPRLQRNWDSRAACNFIGGGAGTGLLLASAAALPAGSNYFPSALLAVALIGFGLSMVWLEIGRPFRALNVFFHPQTSWMTREALLSVPLFALAGIAILADQRLVPLPFQARVPVAGLASAAAAVGLAFMFCQARMLRASRGVPAWREPALQAVIIATGIAEGLGLLLVVSLFVAPPPAWVAPAAIAALVARAIAWEYYRQRLQTWAPAAAVAALHRISLPLQLVGHLLPAALLGAAIIAPVSQLPTAVAGLAVFATGAWLKLTVVTRAGFTQGFTIPFVPSRGRNPAETTRWPPQITQPGR
ncbi:MAG TPA: DmsC/YnfH family molybdoenzyme membrane anchor subunit [Xanthobacteraceae bacterium]|nr:DmsC/YnfH family molybdoenzyme membrane anchor subunit [Xanthobacteraceae bacterium]